MPRSTRLLAYSLCLVCVACRQDDEVEWSKACETVEAVATSWMNWKAAVGELGHHYRYVRETQVSGMDAGSYCLYHTTIEVDGEVVLAREFTRVGTSGDLVCEEGWVEVADEVGSHASSESAAAPALTIEAVYEDCCVVVVPDFGYFYDDLDVGAYSLISYCGDDYCDDGGCQTGPLTDIRIRSLEFLE